MKKNWEVKALGDILKLEYGKPLLPSKRKRDGMYPVYGANGQKDRTDEYYYNKQSIIVGRKGSAGEINITEEAFWPLDVTYFVTFDDEKYNLNFIFHLLSNLDLPRLAKGVKPGINRNEVYSINVKVPPLHEQQRIVAILDRAFVGIAKAKVNAEKNLQNARELFKSYLQCIFINTVPKWEEKRLWEISKINYGYTEKASYNEIGPKFLRITDIQDNNVNWETVPFCKIDKKEQSKYLLNQGDIVFARTGATTGKSYLIDAPPLAVFASYLIRVHILEHAKLTPQFLFLFFQTKTYWDNIEIGLSGSAQGGFNATKLGELSIPIPPLSEQQHIVSKLHALSLETKKLEVLYLKKLTHLEELKKSILHQELIDELMKIEDKTLFVCFQDRPNTIKTGVVSL